MNNRMPKLITQRSVVQIHPPQPNPILHYRRSGRAPILFDKHCFQVRSGDSSDRRLQDAYRPALGFHCAIPATALAYTNAVSSRNVLQDTLKLPMPYSAKLN
jgi:hypothetical protein